MSTQVSGIPHNVTTTAAGEFWRLLVDGTYTYTVHAFGYDSSAPATVAVQNSVDGSGVKGLLTYMTSTIFGYFDTLPPSLLKPSNSYNLSTSTTG